LHVAAEPRLKFRADSPWIFSDLFDVSGSRTIGRRRERHFGCEQAVEERKAERRNPDRSDQLEPHFDSSCVPEIPSSQRQVDALNQP
jgi:hypothetical protein